MEPSSYRESFAEREQHQMQEAELRKSRAAYVDELELHTPQYLFRLGREPISLSLLEYRIIRFLAAQPYKALTRQQIASAIDGPGHPISEATIDGHIRTLRAKLGIFSDYVQSVPYIGYRFKP